MSQSEKEYKVRDLSFAAKIAAAEVKHLTTFNMMDTMDSRHITRVLELEMASRDIGKQLKRLTAV
jgi:hypothetical protein